MFCIKKVTLPSFKSGGLNNIQTKFLAVGPEINHRMSEGQTDFGITVKRYHIGYISIANRPD